MKMRRILPFLAMLLVLAFQLSGVAEHDTRRVFLKGEAPDFSPDEPVLEVYVAPLMSADCFLIRQGDHTMLVDMGTLGNADQIEQMVREAGVDRIEYGFNTHPHEDHLSGIRELMKRFSFDHFLTPFPLEYADRPCNQVVMMKEIAAAGVPIDLVERGDEVALGDAVITIFSHEAKGETLNNQSSMALVSFGDCRMLLTADVESKIVQGLLIEEYPGLLRADIMKCPHHGVSNINPDFLQAVNPEMAFITTGYYNCEHARKYLDKNGIGYGISTWGTMRFVTNGEYWLCEHLLAPEYVGMPESHHTAF